MASYHASFNYLGKNSADEGYILVAFEPDEGFKDTFLDMDQISEDYYDGTKKFLYGTRYNSTAAINITIVKMDGTDWSVNDNRKALRWLTGARTASWLDLCKYKDDELGWQVVYSFLGTVKSPQQYKLDGRVIGLSFEFASISPWAYSNEEEIYRSISQELAIDLDGILTLTGVTEKEMSVSDDGILCNGSTPSINACFGIDDDGIVYVAETFTEQIDNQTDDPYSYIYLDIEYINDSCTWLEIKRELDANIPPQLEALRSQIFNDLGVEIDKYIDSNTKGEYVWKNTAGSHIESYDLCKKYLKLKNEQYEVTRINNIGKGDRIDITGKQFIVAYTKDQFTNEWVNKERIFGDDFNFVWPRLAPGINNLIIEGDANGTVKFSYRYPMKVGDCAMDISMYGSDSICDCQDSIPSYDTIRWQDITGTPTSIAGYGISDAYTENEVDEKLEDIHEKIDNIEISGGGGTGSSVIINEDELNEMLEDILT